MRFSNIPSEITNFIKEMREEHPRIGKESLRPLVDKYCNEKGLKSVSESTIGNIIKRHKLNLDVIHAKRVFNQRLPDYLIFYNAERPHKSLGLKSPLEYLVEKGLMSQMSLTSTHN